MKISNLIAALACGLVLQALPAVAATIQFDQMDYDCLQGGSVTVQVQFDVPVTTPVGGVSAKVCISGGDVPGEVTTSETDVVKAATGTYILINSTGLASNGTTAFCAIGADAVPGFVNDIRSPGVYSLMDITWTASASAWGDYSLEFEDVGLGINGLTYLADVDGNDYLTGCSGATIHVTPEPASLLLLGISGIFGLARRRR